MAYQIITINREFESTGNEIAQAVSARLGIEYYDKFLITAASEDSGIHESRVALYDERPTSRFEYSQTEAAYYFTNAEAPMPTSAQVAQSQFLLIRQLAQKGPCVIVGRCGNYVLRDRDDVLDIFIHADEAFRLKRTIDVLGLPERQAKKVLRSTDRARKAYYRSYTGEDWNNPDQYHACLNPAKLGFDVCVDAICGMYRGAVKD